MAEIINLRLARKRKARNEKAAEAKNACTAHGIAKKDRENAKRVTAAEKRHLDGHMRESEFTAGPKPQDVSKPEKPERS